MPNRLPLPPELMLLIEKREETDRRQQGHRQSRLKTESAKGKTTAPDAPASSEDMAHERRLKKDRRSSSGKGTHRNHKK